MPTQNLDETGRIYDDEQFIAEVAYELDGEGQGATGTITFQDMLESNQVAELLDTKPLTLERKDGQRVAFTSRNKGIGSSPTLSIRLTGSE